MCTANHTVAGSDTRRSGGCISPELHIWNKPFPVCFVSDIDYSIVPRRSRPKNLGKTEILRFFVAFQIIFAIIVSVKKAA